MTVKDVPLRELIDAARKAGVRRVLLTDYAAVEPKPAGGALVLVGMVTVVATALDRKGKVIYRWSETGESERTVTVTAGTGRGPNPGGRLAARKADVFQVLREEGFEVDEGEWTPRSAEAFVTSRREIVG
jgi:hypothetical protein